MYGFTHYLATVYIPAMNSKKLVGIVSPAWKPLDTQKSSILNVRCTRMTQKYSILLGPALLGGWCSCEV